MENSFPPHPESYTEPMQTPHQASRHNAQRKRVVLWAAAGGTVLLVAGAALWFFAFRTKTAKTVKPSITSQQQTPVTPTAADPTPVVYKSTKLNIEITHRKDWTLKESPAGDQLTLTSPAVTYTKANATAGSSIFTLKIRKGVPAAMQTTIEKSAAVRDSEVIAYTAPTESQRYYTNLSYAGTGDNFTFLVVTGSVGLKTGNAFQYMLALNDDTYLLAGGYGADKADSLSFDPVPKGSFDTPTFQQAVDIVKSLKIF